MSIFSVLSQHVDYLSQRYAVAAKNVANVDTPGFKAQKIAEFQQTLNSVGGFQLASSSDGASMSSSDTGSVTYDISPRKNGEVKNSGNDVNMDQEMSEIGETSRQFAVDLNLEKTFQRMFLASLKG